MFHFLKKYKHENLEWIGVDIHSHLLPGLDDGAESIETSIGYIKGLYELGLKKLITTPHVFGELYPNTVPNILSSLEKLKTEPEIQLLGIELGAAAEYMLDSDFDPLLKNEKLLCLSGKYVLIEMSYIAENSNIENYIFELQVKGYKPVLAHPERYIFYHGDLIRLKRLKELGCLMQLNLLSIAGYYGKEVKQMAMKLVKEELVDFVGTDLHHERHLNALKSFVQKGDAYKIIGKYPFHNNIFQIPVV